MICDSVIWIKLLFTFHDPHLMVLTLVLLQQHPIISLICGVVSHTL